MKAADRSFSRRDLLRASAGCGAHVLGALTVAPSAVRAGFAARQSGQVVRSEPFGRLESLSDGVWAMISTPLEGRTTLSNGGIIAGSDGVMIIEGFASVEGAQWMSAVAYELTGRRPTHVLLTHYHGDHSNGLAGYRSDAEVPLVLHTEQTRELLAASFAGREDGGTESPMTVLSSEALVTGDGLEVDLGGRVVEVTARVGHTPSDMTVRVDEPRVVFCGDLVWNDMFPNYVDAIPTRLWSACNELLEDPNALYVPGHGPLADYGDSRRFLAVIEAVGEAGRASFERGIPPADAAADFALPAGLGEWFMFSSRYYEVAFNAWHRELSGQMGLQRAPRPGL